MRERANSLADGVLQSLAPSVRNLQKSLQSKPLSAMRQEWGRWVDGKSTRSETLLLQNF